MNMPERKTIRVAAAVIYKDGRVFATVRGYGEYKGWWEFPGGKIEEGETPQEALVREIKEELTAEISVGELIKSIEYDYPDFHLSMDCFRAEVVRGELVLREAADARWLTKEELDSVKWLPADLELIELIRRSMDKTNKTLAYYTNHAEAFADGTSTVDLGDVQNRFTSLLPAGGLILDFGCGAGRDTKAFLEKGFLVEAIDGSERLCEIASAFTGIPVRRMLFDELDEIEKYDGIWACASILHLPKGVLKDTIGKMVRAVRTGGYIYMSFKHGDFEGLRNERHFTDFTEKAVRRFLADVKGIEIVEMWLSGDVRPGRGDEQWLNIILKKTDLI